MSVVLTINITLNVQQQNDGAGIDNPTVPKLKSQVGTEDMDLPHNGTDGRLKNNIKNNIKDQVRVGVPQTPESRCHRRTVAEINSLYSRNVCAVCTQ